ncbi:MAG: hypothetical protein WB402_14220 [Sulfuricaulis sp.]|uniref:hypothetical protein n=1 Tax=Sulfuricaulis sp. TaxID=2003553 RepID=UPI003C5D8845
MRLITLFRVVSFLSALVIGGPALAISNDYSHAIRLAVDRWLVVQKPSGFLPYDFNFLEDKESEPDSMSTANLARQAGTAVVLADYYAFTKDPRARPAIGKFLTAFGRHSLPIGKSRIQGLVEKTRILSMPVGRGKIRNALERLGLLFDKQGPGKVVSPNMDYSDAFTGTVAFALLTELRFAQTSGDASFSNLRQAWLEALLMLRIPGGGFRKFPTWIDPHPYADGEAWLALAEYHQQFPQDTRVAEMLASVDDSLIKIYGSDFNIDFYHWGTMAAAARYADSKEAKFLDFIKNQTNAFLDSKQELANYNDCASVEGVADALAALVSAGEGESELSRRVRAWITREMAKTEGLQIKPGQKELVFTNARVSAPRLKEFTGSFLAGRYELKTQVDNTSHCVSAMLKLQRQNRPKIKN